MIKCRFIGTITVTAEIDEKQKGLLPYGKIRENWANIGKALRSA